MIFPLFSDKWDQVPSFERKLSYDKIDAYSNGGNYTCQFQVMITVFNFQIKFIS